MATISLKINFVKSNSIKTMQVKAVVWVINYVKSVFCQLDVPES